MWRATGRGSKLSDTKKDRRFDVSDGMLGDQSSSIGKKCGRFMTSSLQPRGLRLARSLSKRAKELRRYYRDKLKKKQQANAEEFGRFEGP